GRRLRRRAPPPHAAAGQRPDAAQHRCADGESGRPRAATTGQPVARGRALSAYLDTADEAGAVGGRRGALLVDAAGLARAAVGVGVARAADALVAAEGHGGILVAGLARALAVGRLRRRRAVARRLLGDLVALAQRRLVRGHRLHVGIERDLIVGGEVVNAHGDLVHREAERRALVVDAGVDDREELEQRALGLVEE